MSTSDRSLDVARRGSPAAGWSRRDLASLALLLVVAAAVRLPGVFSRSIWYDEALTLVIASGRSAWTWPSEPSPVSSQKAIFVPALEAAPFPSLRDVECCHPPLYFALLAAWRDRFGSSLETARLMSFVASLAAVAALWLLARAAGVRWPLLPAGFAALATAAAHGGHEARPYALADGLLVLAALAAWRPATACGAPSTRDWLHGLAAATAAGLAVLTLHLAAFPAAAILLWLAWRAWGRAKALAIAVPLGAAAVAGLGLSLALDHAREADTLRGESSLLAEVSSAARHNAGAFGFGVPRNALAGLQPVLPPLVTAAFCAVAVIAGVGLLRRARADRALPTLAVAYALAPTLGIAVANLGFGWHLTQPRYFSLAASGLALALGVGLGELAPRRRWVRWLLVAIVAIQLSRVNWGSETCADDQTGSITRSMAGLASAAPELTLVAIGAGYGMGDPASWVYELPPETTLLVFSRGDDVAAVAAQSARFPDVWVALASDQQTRNEESRLIQVLTRAGYRVKFANAKAFHLVRRGDLGPFAPPSPRTLSGDR